MRTLAEMATRNTPRAVIAPAIQMPSTPFIMLVHSAMLKMD